MSDLNKNNKFIPLWLDLNSHIGYQLHSDSLIYFLYKASKCPLNEHTRRRWMYMERRISTDFIVNTEVPRYLQKGKVQYLIRYAS